MIVFTSAGLGFLTTGTHDTCREEISSAKYEGSRSTRKIGSLTSYQERRIAQGLRNLRSSHDRSRHLCSNTNHPAQFRISTGFDHFLHSLFTTVHNLLFCSEIPNVSTKRLEFLLRFSRVPPTRIPRETLSSTQPVIRDGSFHGNFLRISRRISLPQCFSYSGLSSDAVKFHGIRRHREKLPTRPLF